MMGRDGIPRVLRTAGHSTLVTHCCIASRGVVAHTLTGSKGAAKHPALGIFDSFLGPPELLQNGSTPTPGQRGGPIHIVSRPIAD